MRYQLDWERVRDITANCSFGVRMYVRKAELVHCPNNWMVESSIPAFAAAVAAPIRKLWPE